MPQSPTNPAKTVEAIGDDHLTRYEAAKAARQSADVLAIVRDMDARTRSFVEPDLQALAAFMSPREIVTVAGLAQADAGATLLAMLEASPPITREQIRSVMADVGYNQLREAFKRSDLVTALREKFPGSPVELLPQLGDEGGLGSHDVLVWLMETTPAKVVARLLLDVPPEWVDYQATALDKLGERGWKWLDAVDARIAAVTKPSTLAAYRAHATRHAQKTEGVTDADREIDDAKHLEQLARWQKVAEQETKQSAASRRREAADLRGRRAAIVAKSTAFEIQQLMQGAGMSAAEQLDWILDKPRLTAAQLREVTMVMDLDTMTVSPRLVAKLQKRFPTVQPELLFSGGLPRALLQAGGLDPKIGKWLLNGASPETILRVVASQPDLIDEWCATLVAMGIGFGWVQQLGGYHNDYLLRRFALKCPDPAARQYIEERLLGTGTNPGKTKTAPVATPEAYSPAIDHLDIDLERASKHEASTRVSDAIAADVRELKPAEVEAVRHDAKRLKQLLATANQKTFPQILAYLQPELQVATALATPQNIAEGDYVVFAATRPAREVITTLSSPMYVDRVQAIVKTLGPFEVFPPLASADVLSRVLRANPSIIDWMLASEPSQVIRAFGAPAAIDAAVAALSTLDDFSVFDEAWPSAEALGPGGRSVLVQLGARAKGPLKEAIDEKLKAKLPAESEEREDADRNAQAVRASGEVPERVAELLERDAPAPTLLAVCREAPDTWREIAKYSNTLETLATKLVGSPDFIFNVPLAQLLADARLHPWIFKATPAFRILDAVTAEAQDAFVANVEAASAETNAFLDQLPRGRGLSPANKTTLHRVARRLKNDARFEQLFEITFDTPANKLSRPELDKLWSVLAVLPQAHVDQQAISQFTGIASSPDGTTAGLYTPETRGIKLQTGKLGARDAAQYDHHVALTEQEAIEAVGSKAELERLVDSAVMVKNDDATYSFRPQTNLETFSHTILHEVGHAVDYMLGAQTELIYGLVGWKRFEQSDFDAWANELGGWDKVTEPDKKQIRQIWISWLSGGGKGTVIELVDSDHPLSAERYAQVGVVQLARKDLLYELTPANGRYAMAHHSEQSWFTLSAKGHNAAPSAYALTAPEEYFAECYASYYRELTETPPRPESKGSTLVPWIKGWFDTHIDKVGHNPQRHGRR